MIPKRLNVRNFLCYREDVPTLDFDGIHVACLCGENGHGKSALLDSITWCLWGTARGKTQDELISYGSDECRVEFEFLSRDLQYRVIRSHTRSRGRSRSGASALQLQILDADHALTISANTIRETQTKINQIVGMEYDTFINSAFLMQGRSDEFTSKTPGERKNLLADILGLQIYEELQKRARDKIRESESEISYSQGMIETLQQQLNDIGDPTKDLAHVTVELSQLEKASSEKTNQLDNLRQQVNDLLGLQKQQIELEGDISRYTEELERITSQITTISSRVQDWKNTIATSHEIESALNRLKEYKSQIEQLDKTKQIHDAITHQRDLIYQNIQHQEQTLSTQISQARSKIENNLKPLATSHAELLQRKSDILSLSSELEKSQTKLNETKQLYENLLLHTADLNSEAERQKSEGEDIRQKLLLIGASSTSETLCPLCQTSIGEEGHRSIRESYDKDITDRRQAYREILESIKVAEAKKSSLSNEILNSEETIRKEQSAIQTNRAEIELRITESIKAQEELNINELELSKMEQSLALKTFAQQEETQISDLNTELENLMYDHSAREILVKHIQELQYSESASARLEQAKNQITEDEQLLTNLEESLESRQRDITNRRERLLEGTIALEGLPEQQSQLNKLTLEMNDLEATHQATATKKALLENKLSDKMRLSEQLEATTSKLSTYEGSQGIFRELSTIFGREGIQAMLIETVVPRLEEETNSLLGRMTDNRMHVKLETQKERRSGNGEPIETLEINVSVELGSRSYEMYSGGEAFRINLAIRIALSKVLAQRTGAPLPTLFIDEGFGTQDAASRERVLDAISSIQDDFDKIIVITHLEDLKDMFPVRIEVQKSATGSTFWLS